MRFTETVLRDGNQSLMATRMPLSDVLPALPLIDRCGYYSVECWGGATFDACLRYLNEDPWERLRTMRRLMPRSRLQMLLRGQNLLGYRHYPDDIVEKFVELSIKNGIDIVRVFDALNDLCNVRTAVEATLKYGGEAAGAICYTTSPVHTVKKFVELGRELKSMGCATVCVKDMAGVITPREAATIVAALKDALPDTPVVLHTHCTTGMAYMAALAAVNAGCGIIDTAVSSFSGGTSQPATETLNYALSQLGYATGLAPEDIKGVNDLFRPLRDRYLAQGLLKPRAMVTDTDALNYKVPGGMLSNMIANLEEMGASDKLDEALEEIPCVRAELGYPPLVTPMSQMVGNQAVSNVITGERYKTVSREVRAYIRGEYGAPPGKIDEALEKRVLGGERPFKGRFADTLAPGLKKAEKEAGALARREEDVLTFALFPSAGREFLEKREQSRERSFAYTVEPLEERE